MRRTTRIRKTERPKVHVFGHIHGGGVNAAYLNEQYKPLKPAGKIRIIDV